MVINGAAREIHVGLSQDADAYVPMSHFWILHPESLLNHLLGYRPGRSSLQLPSDIIHTWAEDKQSLPAPSFNR